MVKKIKIRIRDENSGSYFRELRNNSLKRMRIRDLEIFLILDPGSGMEKFGSGINILDSQNWVFPRK
jgi:hypothetical protein